MHYLFFIPFLFFILCIYLELRVRLAYRRFIDVRTGKPIPINNGYLGAVWDVIRMRLFHLSFASIVKQSSLRGPAYADWNVAPAVTLCEPDDVKLVLKNIDDFPKDMNNFERIKYINPLFGLGSVFVVNNPDWHGQRSLLNKAFVSNSIFFEPVCKSVNTIITKWENQAGKVCVGQDLQKLTLDVLASCIFGLDFDTLNGKQSEPLEAYNNALDAVFNPFRLLFPDTIKLPTKSNQEMFKNLDFFDKYCWQMMDETKKKMEAKKNEGDKHNECHSRSIIEMMIENNLPEKTVRDNLSAFFVVGHETTANSLAWLLALLVSHQDVQEKARKEVLDKIPGEVTFESLKELPYLDGFIKESLRIFPPLSLIVGRQAVKDTVIGNIQIPEGTNINLNVIAMGHNQKIWGDPEVVRPERWYPENMTKEQRGAWMPFSNGPRICIGMSFSLLEQKLFLVYLLKRFQQVKLDPTGKIVERVGGINTYTPETEKIVLQLEKTK